MSIKLVEDEILVNNIKKYNDVTSESSLYIKYKELLFSYLKKKYPNNKDLDDDVSEILIKIFTSLNKFDDTLSTFKTWVINVAKNYMIDKYKKKKIKTIDLNDKFNWDEDNTLKNTSLTYNHNQSYPTNYDNENMVDYLNKNLSVSDFNMLNLHYHYGYSYSEIGDRFNLTSETVSNKVNYIKTKLKKKIDKDIIFS